MPMSLTRAASIPFWLCLLFLAGPVGAQAPATKPAQATKETPQEPAAPTKAAAEGTRIPKDGRRESGGNPVSALQLGMKSMLELEFQLERVDYTKENFVHADMSPEEFAKSMSERGESFLQMFFRMMNQGMAAQ